MEETSTVITSAVRKILDLIPAERIILFSHKRSIEGDTSSFKLCIVVPEGDKRAAERRIYLEVDCPVPFDVVVYTHAEWETFCAEPESFAARVCRIGRVLHG